MQHYAAQLEELAVRDNHRPYLAFAHRAWGIAHRLNGENAKAEERLAQALEMFEDMEAGWQAGRTLVELAEVDLAKQDSAAAMERLNRALPAFERLNAKPDIKNIQAALEVLA